MYEPHSADDGARVLIDRLWPRGVRKEAASLTLWLKDAAPTPALRAWFGHDPERYAEFARRYQRELATGPKAAAAVDQLVALARAGPVTLLYAAKDPACNHAIVLGRFVVDALALPPGDRAQRPPRPPGLDPGP